MTEFPSPEAAETEAPLRLFTAIDFPPDVVSGIGDLLTRLQKGAIFTGAHPAWIKAENVHITLVFLGRQEQQRVARITESMNLAAGTAAPFRLRLGGLHLFPNPREPKVISLGISGDLKGLSALREELASRLRQQGFPVESRPFRPHITLARIKSMKGLAGLRSLVASHRLMEAGEFQVERITLYRSTLTRTGSIYDLLHQAPFTG